MIVVLYACFVNKIQDMLFAKLDEVTNPAGARCLRRAQRPYSKSNTRFDPLFLAIVPRPTGNSARVR